MKRQRSLDERRLLARLAYGAWSSFALAACAAPPPIFSAPAPTVATADSTPTVRALREELADREALAEQRSLSWPMPGDRARGRVFVVFVYRSSRALSRGSKRPVLTNESPSEVWLIDGSNARELERQPYAGVHEEYRQVVLASPERQRANEAALADLEDRLAGRSCV
jgi:hypothetical protein